MIKFLKNLKLLLQTCFMGLLLYIINEFIKIYFLEIIWNKLKVNYSDTQ